MSVQNTPEDTLGDTEMLGSASLDVRTSTVRPAPVVASNESREIVWPETDELFRGIYTRAGLGFTREIVAVTSALPGDGKSTLSLALAIALAQDFPDRNVILIETDVARPTLSSD